VGIAPRLPDDRGPMGTRLNLKTSAWLRNLAVKRFLEMLHKRIKGSNNHLA
jgi:hypothetical protein